MIERQLTDDNTDASKKVKSMISLKTFGSLLAIYKKMIRVSNRLLYHFNLFFP